MQEKPRIISERSRQASKSYSKTNSLFLDDFRIFLHKLLVCEKSEHNRVQLCIFLTSLSQNKPVLIGFFWDKLIAHNPIKDEHKLIKATDNPIKDRFICNIFSHGWKCTSKRKNFAIAIQYRLEHVHPRVVHVQHRGTHFLCEWNGRTNCHSSWEMSSTIFFYLTQNRNHIIFIIWWVQILSIIRTNVLFSKMLRPNARHKLRLCMSNLESSRSQFVWKKWW